MTVFEKHAALIALLQTYGFVRVGTKTTVNGEESVYERQLGKIVGDVVRDYPRIPLHRDRHFVLSIYPVWHSRLLPDSLLKTESPSILADVSHTNSIHKIYLTAMRGVDQLQTGDTLLIYRTKDRGPGYHTSVITSLCVVEELAHIDRFESADAFIKFCEPYSVFEDDELRKFYRTKRYPWLVRFTYNLAFSKRPNRRTLLDEIGLSGDAAGYWGFFRITTDQLRAIVTEATDYEKTRSLVYSPRTCRGDIAG